LSQERSSRLRSLGPAIIVASVVMGPGSILVSSRVGCDFSYGLIWLVLLAAVLMIGMTALSAHLGAVLDHTPCEELARRAGRPVAVMVGLVLFLVIACFQFSNNVAVVLAVEPYAGEGDTWPLVLLVTVNLMVLGVLFGLRQLYRRVEFLMKMLVGIMMLGFLGNLAFASPALSQILAGLWPSLPESLTGAILPTESEAKDQVVDPLLPVQALIGTTFSVAGAFYQAYLVREKGWTRGDLRAGRLDSIVGISVLGLLTLTVMVTAAAVLHGRIEGKDLGHAADVARQLEPLFGTAATLLFSIGLLAGAFSSFLINVMIGGAVLSDGVGLGGSMDRPGPKVFTAIALLIGMVVAMAVVTTGEKPVQLVVFAQALTVLGNPILAGVLLWLSRRAGVPRWIQVVAVLGFLLVLVLALRTGVSLYLRLT